MPKFKAKVIKEGEKWIKCLIKDPKTGVFFGRDWYFSRKQIEIKRITYQEVELTISQNMIRLDRIYR